MAILSSPASCAVQITGTCRVKQDSPWNVTIVRFRCFLLKRTSFQTGIDNKVGKECLPYARIQFIDSQDQLIPVAVLILNSISDSISLCLIPALRHKLIYQFHQFRYILFRIFFQIAKTCFHCRRKSSLFCFVHQFHNNLSSLL